MSLPEQFRPTSQKQLAGNSKAIKQLEEAISSYKTSLVTGPPGIGKTSSCKAIANDIGWAVKEWNASDSRNKDDFEQILRELRNKPFKNTIFILDELDGVEDFKGVEECIKFTKSPLVLIANDIFKIPQSVQLLLMRTRNYKQSLKLP